MKVLNLLHIKDDDAVPSGSGSGSGSREGSNEADNGGLPELFQIHEDAHDEESE